MEIVLIGSELKRGNTHKPILTLKNLMDCLSEEGVLLKTDFNDVVVEETMELAFVHCAVTFAAHNKSGEKTRQITNRFTIGLRKENECWIIKRLHSSLPISTETGKGIFKLK